MSEEVRNIELTKENYAAELKDIFQNPTQAENISDFILKVQQNQGFTFEGGLVNLSLRTFTKTPPIPSSGSEKGWETSIFGANWKTKESEFEGEKILQAKTVVTSLCKDFKLSARAEFFLTFKKK